MKATVIFGLLITVALMGIDSNAGPAKSGAITRRAAPATGETKDVKGNRTNVNGNTGRQAVGGNGVVAKTNQALQLRQTAPSARASSAPVLQVTGLNGGKGPTTLESPAIGEHGPTTQSLFASAAKIIPEVVRNLKTEITKENEPRAQQLLQVGIECNGMAICAAPKLGVTEAEAKACGYK